MELLLIRHAEPVRIVDAEGPANPPLHDRGIQQAERLAAWLADEQVDALWSSPLLRARQTAAPIGRVHNLPVVVDDELAEFDRDATSYIPVEELKATGDPLWHAMVAGDLAAAGDRDPEEFKATIVGAIERVIEANPGGRVALVCHGGVMNVYLAAVLGIERLMWHDVPYTAVSRVAASRAGVRSIRSINETAHLRGTGLLLA